MINIKFSKKPVEAEPIVKNWDHFENILSLGKSYRRLYLDGEDNKSLAIRVISKDILDKPPGFDFLHWIGIRKRIVLHVQEEKISNEQLVRRVGYVAVNSESLRKRLRLKKSTFYQEIKKDEKHANDFIQKAIDKECAQSLDIEARDYLYGRNEKEKNPEKAFELFKRAANGGLADGFGNLAYCYSHGIGVTKNSNEALKALKRRLNNVDPKEKLGLLSMFASSRIKEIEFLTDDPKILTELGIALLNGNKNFVPEEKKAFELFQKAAKQNYPLAFEQLSFCYSSGKGIEKNSDEALNHLNMLVGILKNIHQGNFKDALVEHLIILMNKAPEIFVLFCEKNPEYYVDVSKMLFKMADFLKNEQLKANAFEYLQKAAAHNLIEAHAGIAFCHFNGKGVEKSAINAFETLAKIRPHLNSEKEVNLLLSHFILGL